MGIRFNPNDASGEVLAAGKYDVTINAVEEKRGKTSGTRYLAVSLTAYSGDRDVTVFDNVMLEGRGAFRLKQLMLALGLRQEFDSGDVDPSKLVGRSLSADLEVEQDDQFGDKNIVKKYHAGTTVSRSATVAKPPSRAAATIDDESIPF